MTEHNPPSPAVIRPGRAGDSVALADAFRQMWLDNGVPAEHIEPDFRARVERFVADGQRDADLAVFIAERAGEVVGTACCQLFRGLYPAILRQDVRRYGYVWGVHVAEAERRAGLGQRLVEACLDALRALGCTHAVLHAAPPGRGVYERLGFQATNEMRLPL